MTTVNLNENHKTRIKTSEKEGKNMKIINEKELIKKYIEEDNKCCVIVYPNTDWMEKLERKEFKKMGDFVCRKLHLKRNALYEIIDNTFLIYDFYPEQLSKKGNLEDLESYKFFKTFKDPDEMFYVQLYINGKFADENT